MTMTDNLEEEYEAKQKFIKDETEALAVLKQQLETAEKLTRQLRAEVNYKSESVVTERRNLREMEREVAKQKRLRAAEEKRTALLKEFNERAAALDDLTSDADWRQGIDLNGKILKAFEHQIEGAKRLAVAKRGILGDKRGLGKTLTGIAYLDMVQARRVVIIAPNDVVPQFAEEVQMWASKRQILTFAGLNKDQRRLIYPMLKMLDSFVILINYEAWRRDKTVIDDLIAARVDTVILDEAHRAKSFTKQTAQGILQLIFYPNVCPNGHEQIIKPWHKIGRTDNGVNGPFKQASALQVYTCDTCGSVLDKSVVNTLSMTGTPILNKPQEIFVMLHIVDPFRFPNEQQFLRDYCYSYAPGKWRFMEYKMDQFINSISEFFVQRTREDAGIHIPPPRVTTHYLDKDPINYPQQYQAYKDLTTAAAMVTEDGTAVDILYMLEILMRERQIITWPGKPGVDLKIRDQNPMSPTYKEVIQTLHFEVEESQKLDAVVELLDELSEEGERWICFSKFKAPLYEGKRRLESKYSVTTATGDDPKFHKDRVRLDFDLKTASANPKWVGCFATFDAFATGINLNAARHVIFIDDEWNPGMEDQAIGRIDRMNNEDEANVHIFRVRKTVDEFMEDLIEQKRKTVEGFETGISAADLLKHLREV